jgi:hypothetical protein
MTEEELKKRVDEIEKTLELDTPNLDCLPDHLELVAWGRVFRRLADYSLRKAVACAGRMHGELASALWYEQQAEESYNLLPKGVRW